MAADRMRQLGTVAIRTLFILAVLCGTLWTGAVGCLWMAETSLVFRANRSRIVSPASYEGLLQLRADDGILLDAVALETDSGSNYWVLFCPPAAGTIHGRLRPQLFTLQELGYNVFAFDYRGFGRNRGEPSEEGLYEDALAAYRYLVNERGISPANIILAGRSLGSAVAVELRACEVIE